MNAAEQKISSIIREAELVPPRLDSKVGHPLNADTGVSTDEDIDAISVSDDELASRFTARFKDELRYVAAWDRWLIWDGRRWAKDEKKSVYNLSRGICREALNEHLTAGLIEPKAAALRKRLGSAQTIYAVVKLAGSDPRHAIAASQLDADPWVLNTPDGIVDLRTGTLLPPDPAKLLTRITTAPASGICPLFLEVLERVVPDPEKRAYLQRLAGYALTGLSREHFLSFWYGQGRNGKGTIAHALRYAIGDYGLEIGPEIFMEAHNDRHLTEVAVLHGARLVVVSEIDTGRRWNEACVKRLTGGDPISARFIAKDLFEFTPTHTLIFVANNKPGMRNVDEAMRARIHLVEFGITIPEGERDVRLPERLQAEAGGILKWMVDGCLAYKNIGLAPPDSIKAATAAYLEAEDSVAQWAKEECDSRGQITLKAAFSSYSGWCKENSVAALGKNAFGDQLEAHGFKRSTDSHAKTPVYSGLSLLLSPNYQDHEEF